MRGSTVKVLRLMARLKHMELVASGELAPPQSPEHARHQRKVLLRHLKKAFGSMPHAVKGRSTQRFRNWRTENSGFQRRSTDSDRSDSS